MFGRGGSVLMCVLCCIMHDCVYEFDVFIVVCCVKCDARKCV